MSWRQVTCLQVECDGCGDGWNYGDQDSTPHFPNHQAALAALADTDWTHDADTVLCGTCAAIRDCERAGHDWTPWRTAGPLERPQGAWQGRIRFCQACPDSQWDPPLTPATTMSATSAPVAASCVGAGDVTGGTA